MPEKRIQKTYPDSTVQTLEPEPIEVVTEPTDEELLAGFRSHYQNFPPDQMIKGASNEPARRASDLVGRDRVAYLARRRAELAGQRAYQEEQQRQQAREQAQINKALRQEAREALRAAVQGYREWSGKRDELRDSLQERQTRLANLLESQSPEVDLEQLKKQTAEVADCRLLADALRARLSAWQAKESGYIQPLRQAVGVAQGELSILHLAERDRRIAIARGQLDVIIDLSRLHELASFGQAGANGERLAALARPVTELDRVAGYSGSSYSWQYSVHDTQLLTKAAELERYYMELVPLVARA